MEKLRSMVVDEACQMQTRGIAAERLANHPLAKRAVPQLLEGASHPNTPLRFWCVFALGHIICRYPAMLPILERFLDDFAPNEETYYWPVALEARYFWLSGKGELDQLQAEVNAIRANPNAKDYEMRRADCYGFEQAKSQVRV